MINFEDRNSELEKEALCEAKTQEMSGQQEGEPKDQQNEQLRDMGESQSPLKSQSEGKVQDQPEDKPKNHTGVEQTEKVENQITKGLKEMSLDGSKSKLEENDKSIYGEESKEDVVGKMLVSERKNSISVGASLPSITGKSLKENIQEVVEGEAKPPKELQKELADANTMRKQQEGPKSISEYEVINKDPMLKHYEHDIRARVDLFNSWLKRFDENEGGILNLAESYKRFGLNRVKGGIQYREWAPSAQKVSLCGDFNGWNRGSHECKRNQYGVWELFVPDLADGTPAIKHGSRVKAALILCDGNHVYLFLLFYRLIEILLGYVTFSRPKMASHTMEFTGTHQNLISGSLNT